MRSVWKVCDSAKAEQIGRQKLGEFNSTAQVHWVVRTRFKSPSPRLSVFSLSQAIAQAILLSTVIQLGPSPLRNSVRKPKLQWFQCLHGNRPPWLAWNASANVWCPSNCYTCTLGLIPIAWKLLEGSWIKGSDHKGSSQNCISKGHFNSVLDYSVRIMMVLYKKEKSFDRSKEEENVDQNYSQIE